MADEVKEFRYRVKGSGSVIAHNFEDYREGDEISLPRHVAMNFRNQLEPLDPEGRLEEAPKSSILKNIEGFPDHEREQVLEEYKVQLEGELEPREKELEKVEAELNKIRAGRKSAEKPAETAKKK